MFANDLRTKIMRLHEGPWERRASGSEIDQWLDNFTGVVGTVDEERLHALHLLSVFTYFGEQEMRVLLRAMFRDLYRYPIVEQIRKANNDSTDTSMIRSLFNAELAATRFIGMGNPAESGTHLLYHFRQESSLHKDLFINTLDIFSGRVMSGLPSFENPSIRHYVFIDDFCGSGTQARQYSTKIIEVISDVAKSTSCDVTTAYYVLAATAEGIENVRSSTGFNRVEAVLEFDDTYKAFSDNSRYYPADLTEVSRVTGRAIADTYGRSLVPYHPLGYKEGQMLLGFRHNIPDNTLPIFWYGESSHPWYPIFRRYPKIGG